MFLISPPSLTFSKDKARLSARIVRGRHLAELWFEVPDQYGKHLVDDRLDSFFLGLLPLAMAQGETLRAEGPVSERLLTNMQSKIIPLLRGLAPKLKRITVEAASIARRPLDTTGEVMTGFSGGIDSFCLLRDRFLDMSPGAPGRITHFVFNDVGSHGPPSALSESRFKARLSRASKVVQELHCPILSVRSNLDDFVPMSFEQSHSLRNAAAVLTVQKLVGQYLYASAYHYSDCHCGPSHYIAMMDPVLLPFFSTETTEVLSVGCEYRRTEKTYRVSDIDLAYRYLHTCIADRSAENCSKCSKCLRTLFTLELLGRLNRFQSLYDPNTYGRHRSEYMVELLKGKGPFDREIIALADRVGFEWPLWARVASLIYPARSLAFVRMIWRRTLELTFLEGWDGIQRSMWRWQRRINRKMKRQI